MSRITDFYRGTETDHAGRTLPEYWTYDDDMMESRHDFIQWMFPLREPSQFNRHAPLLSDADIAAFRKEPQLRQNLLHSLDRFLGFLGLCRSDDRIAPDVQRFSQRQEILNEPNHNWLRITRVLHSLQLLGEEEQGRRLLECLERLQADGRAEITPDTFQYWRNAIGSRRDR